MIDIKRPITLKPYKDYKNKPEKYQEKLVGNMKTFGDFQQFQIHDYNRTSKDNLAFGFFYLQIYGCEIDLKPGDMVTIDKILYLQNKNKLAIIGCTIKEKSPFQTDDEIMTDDIGDELLGF